MAQIIFSDCQIFCQINVSNGGQSSVQVHQSIPFAAGHIKFIRAKTQQGLSDIYIDSLDQYLTQFGRGRESQPINHFTVQHLDNWFLDRDECPATQASNVGRLSSFFGFAVRRGWRSDNPCDLLEKVRVERPVPKILYPRQVEKMLRTCRTSCIPFAVLATFEGFRPEAELMKMDWNNINLNEGTVLVLESKTCRRLIKLHEVTIAWLKAFPIRRGPVCPSYMTLRRFRQRACSVLNITWSQDLLRHTAASFMIARHKDLGIVAARLGHSVKILQKHYHNPIPDGVSEKFWRVFP